jgi:hypothetical protein
VNFMGMYMKHAEMELAFAQFAETNTKQTKRKNLTPLVVSGCRCLILNPTILSLQSYSGLVD